MSQLPDTINAWNILRDFRKYHPGSYYDAVRNIKLALNGPSITIVPAKCFREEALFIPDHVECDVGPVVEAVIEELKKSDQTTYVTTKLNHCDD
jgi:hypothetical protein